MMIAGCQTTPTISNERSSVSDGRTVVPSLVTVADGTRLAGTAAGWEASRNDAPEHRQVTPDRSGMIYTEVRHRESLRTSNGRPREHSVTRTRTIERRGSSYSHPRRRRPYR